MQFSHMPWAEVSLENVTLSRGSMIECHMLDDCICRKCAGCSYPWRRMALTGQWAGSVNVLGLGSSEGCTTCEYSKKLWITEGRKWKRPIELLACSVSVPL